MKLFSLHPRLSQQTSTMLGVSAAMVVLGLAFSCNAQEPCHGALGHHNCPPQDWHVGLDHVDPSGTVVHGHVNTPSSNGLQGSVHGSHVFGGPHNGAQSVGGGVNYQHPSGLNGGLDVTHSRGQGDVVSGTLGGSTQLGPGTLSIDGGANTVPHSSKVEGSVGATYTVPLP